MLQRALPQLSDPAAKLLHGVDHRLDPLSPQPQLLHEPHRPTATAGQPDPDLVIRTSGEMRLSNFLLWQVAYAELYVTDTYWPDFRRPHLLRALEAYRARNRRFGEADSA